MNDFDYLAQLPGEEREQDWIRMRLGTLSVRESIVLTAAAQADPPENAVQAINRLQSLDEYTVCLNTGSYEALGRRYLINDTAMPMDALAFADLEAVGEQYEDRHPGLFIGNCYVQYPETPPEPIYWPGLPLPDDDGWSVKLKVSSSNQPEGVWLRLPGPFVDGCSDTVEEALALRELGVRRWDECSLVDARCVLPEAGDLIEQYSGAVGELIDEGIWLSNVTTIEYIRNTLKRVRKKESSLILASQNLEDFDVDGIRELTRPLFAIPTHQFLFNAGSVDKKFYMDNLQLEGSEYELIRYPQRGVCLYKCGNERYLLEVKVPDYKEKLFGKAGGR